MKNKKIGIGSLSLLLVIIAFVWAFNIFGVCVGDHILATLNIPTWSNMANATGIVNYNWIHFNISINNRREVEVDMEKCKKRNMKHCTKSKFCA